ncbi:MAG: tRNA epoxyqueuosine(34) reductase QueG [Hyphomicrobiales bacterium]
MPGLAAEIRHKAQELGFATVGFAPTDFDARQAERLRAFVDRGLHGDMAWLATTLDRRVSPERLWPDARTAIVLTMSYPEPDDPFGRLQRRSQGTIAAYALGRDYHDVLKGRLKQLAGWLAARTGAEVKVFVDTAPLMEKPLAQRAGLGWQGKHTNLVSRTLGSWTFLGAILTTLAIDADTPDTDHCGSCRACLDVCPTSAFPAPYQLDARRCISYLTIEHKGPIPDEFRKAIGNRIFGCDDCLAVCPWNKFAAKASEAKFAADERRVSPSLAALAELDDGAFRTLFAGSPIKRLGIDRFLRNVLIAIGNSGDEALLPAAERHLKHAAPVVRGAAVWAMRQFVSPTAFDALRHGAQGEPDPTVRREWGLDE